MTTANLGSVASTVRAGGSVEERLGGMSWVLEVSRAGEGRALLTTLHAVSERLRATLPTAKKSASRAASTGSLASPAWSAPEELSRSAAPDALSDVWAFGLIAFRLMTGRSYWSTEPGDYAASVLEVTSSPLTEGSSRSSRFPRALDAWLARCVTRDREARYSNVGAAFGAFLEHVPLARRAEPKAGKAGKPAARPAPSRRPPESLLPLLLVAVLVVPVGLTILGAGLAIGISLADRRSSAAAELVEVRPTEPAPAAPAPPPLMMPIDPAHDPGVRDPSWVRPSPPPRSGRLSGEVLDPWADRFAVTHP